MKSKGADLHLRAAQREVKAHVYSDAPSKPQRANTKAQHTEFVVAPHPDKSSGYKGAFVPKNSKTAAAAKKFLAKQNAPVDL